MKRYPYQETGFHARFGRTPIIHAAGAMSLAILALGPYLITLAVVIAISALVPFVAVSSRRFLS